MQYPTLSSDRKSGWVRKLLTSPESQAFILEVFCVCGGVVGQRRMGGELLVAKSWSSDPVYICYSVNYVYPTEIKGHFMVSLVISPVYHFNHYHGFEWLIEAFILLLFHNSNKKLQIVCISPCLPMPETMAKIFMWHAVHVTSMKGEHDDYLQWPFESDVNVCA